ADLCSDLLEIVSGEFSNIAIVGLQSHLTRPSRNGAAEEPAGKTITDLQGQLSLLQMIAVIAQARFFVGIDSMPAHVAQAFGLKSAIVFGSIHPLARVWDRQAVWPIVAPLPCIGCYHEHLEPSIPFCMRHDEACMSALSKAEVQTQFRAM